MGQWRNTRIEWKKGDHLIGDFYVLFNTKLKEETDALEKQGMSKEEAEANAPLMQQARRDASAMGK